MLSWTKHSLLEYRDHLVKKQVFSGISEYELAKLTIANAALEQMELVELHAPQIVVAVKVLLLSRLRGPSPSCDDPS